MMYERRAGDVSGNRFELRMVSRSSWSTKSQVQLALAGILGWKLQLKAPLKGGERVDESGP